MSNYFMSKTNSFTAASLSVSKHIAGWIVKYALLSWV